MKILVINGSPKKSKSNTIRLTNAFVDGIKEKSAEKNVPVEVRELQVYDMKINPCKGCFVCWKTTPGQCCMNDDMISVIEAELWADIIIWSFPLYYYNVPGAVKNLIDRQLPMVLPFMVEDSDSIGSGSHPPRYDMTAKRYVLISTCGFYSAENNYDSVLRMFDHICGKNNYETIFCGQGELFHIPELSEKTNQYLEYVQKAGYEFAFGDIHTDTKNLLKKLLYSKEVFETMADASWGINKENEVQNESLVFTKQMAALYNKNSYDGTNRVLEMNYTDLNVTYQIELKADGSVVHEGQPLPYTTRIETPYPVWKAISRGELRGDTALMEQKYRVLGDFSLIMQWGHFFGA